MALFWQFCFTGFFAYKTRQSVFFVAKFFAIKHYLDTYLVRMKSWMTNNRVFALLRGGAGERLWIKKYGPYPTSFSIYFRSFQANSTFFSTSICEKVRPVSGAGIRTDDLLNTSWPLDQGSHPKKGNDYQQQVEPIDFLVVNAGCTLPISWSNYFTLKLYTLIG